ncbi:hypothetical protein N6H14_08170 [Paenibacillus sp. CC-CFT747]|nr:hypothetical protein N6H14_08170 [Paenibacillus sp. CC-CFT747]
MREPTDDQLNELEKELRRAMPDYLARSPRPGETQSLLQSLQEEFNTLKEEPSVFPAASAGTPSLYRLVRSQLRLYSRSFWLAGLLLLVLLLTSGSSVRFLGPGGLYSLLLPVLLFSGMAYSLRSSNGAMRLLESITPYPPALLLLGRWVIVLTLTLLMGAAGSLTASFEKAPVPALEFLLGWLPLSSLPEACWAGFCCGREARPPSPLRSSAGPFRWRR